jgi:hypothetical protein
MTTDNHDPFALGGTQNTPADGDTEAWAALEFEPVEDLDGTMRALSYPQWGQTTQAIGEDLRIAAKLLEKTKAEIIRGSRELGPDELMDLIDSLHQTQELLKSYAALAKSAEVRLLVAASTLMTEPQP